MFVDEKLSLMSDKISQREKKFALSQPTLRKALRRCQARTRGLGLTLVATVLAVSAAPASAEILWSGSFETGDFTQWHAHDDRDTVVFWEVPPYGRPIQYGEQDAKHVGNGDLLSLVSKTERTVGAVLYPKGPTRGKSPYAAKYTVKNSSNGSEPADCDGDVCTRRRSELTVQAALPNFYQALGYKDERWISVSHFLPQDWEDGGSSWGPTVFQVKPKLDGGGVGPCVNIGVSGAGWTIKHSWTDVEDLRSKVPWQQRPEYTSTYPSPDGDDDGADLRGDFPDQAVSQAALADLNKGGWTDWVINVKFDARGASDGGEGFLRVWKRAGSDGWVEVLNIVPKRITRGGLTYDRGICFNSPDGFGIKAGMYMDKSQVWNLRANRVLYNANIKVGDAATLFSEMSPDGSSPVSQSADPERDAPPKPPTITQTQ